MYESIKLIDVFFSKTFFLGTKTWRQRIRVYIQDVWNKCDLIAVTLFIIGLICRYNNYTQGQSKAYYY